MKKHFIKDLFIHTRWYIGISIGAFLFLFAFFVPLLWDIAVIYLIVFAALTLLEYILLFAGKEACRRSASQVSG